ncbi:MAG: hypothetical protein P0116_15845 [Candidatus Nitrosocosmicus sp.]|nr:hypothetical protein [Candidatus Nitrosocosmicus sp.]
MPIPAKSNTVGKKKIGIEEILDVNNPETEIYRDIFRYSGLKLLSHDTDDKKKEIKENTKNSLDTVFRIRELTNWLLENHGPFKSDYNLPYNRSTQAHSKNTQVNNKIKYLIQLGLIVEEKKKVKSYRNPNLETHEYDLTIPGFMLTLKLYLDDLTEGTPKYKQLLRMLLEQSIHSIPEGQKDLNNFYYNFIKNLLEKCLNSQTQILIKFVDLASVYLNDFYSLRYHFNNYISTN